MRKTITYKKITIALILFLVTVSLSFSQSAKEYPSVDEVNGLSIGDTVPDFEAIGTNVDTFQLSQALKDGPVVVVFYRGQWCPVCNRHLSALQDSLELITDQGAQVVAISPEKPEYEAKTAQKTGVTFTLLYDKDYKISTLFDVIFQPDSGTLLKYDTFLNADLKQAQSDDSQRLPIPATFIIDKDGIIVWRQFNPDYKVRASVKAILEHIP